MPHVCMKLYPGINLDQSNSSTYIMLEDRLEALFKEPEEYAILERFDWLHYL